MMYGLAEELSEQGLRVVVTTTTKIYRPDHYTLSTPDSVHSLSQGEIRVVGDACAEEPAKLSGIGIHHPFSWVTNNICDVVLVEADGAREKPLKAPKPGEPVLPIGCNLVIGVTGWDGLAAPAGPEVIHRWPLFQKLTGQIEGEPVNDFALIRLLNSSKGLFGEVPNTARVCWLINKVEDEYDRAEAQIMCQTALQYSHRIDTAVIGALQSSDRGLESIFNRH